MTHNVRLFDLLKAFTASKRPVLILGAGARNEAVLRLSEVLEIPVLVTWAMRDYVPEGLSFGTHAPKAGNLAVMNSDFILSIGCRLDTKATGTPVSDFAPHADIWMVDIDEAEIKKHPYHGMTMDSQDFVREFIGLVTEYKDLDYDGLGEKTDPYYEWKCQITDWKDEFPVTFHNDREIDPYEFYDILSKHLSDEDIIVCDTGLTLAWAMQALKFRKGQTFLHSFNQTPMGFGLPAAIGAFHATGKRIVLLTGDGSFMMSLQELATARGLPIKIFLLNNEGHGMCRQTENQWFNSHHCGTDLKDLKFPQSFCSVLKGFGINHYGEVRSPQHLETSIQFTLQSPSTTFLEVKIPPDAELKYQVKYGEKLA